MAYYRITNAVSSIFDTLYILGTGMTFQDLTDKVTSQLVEHKLLLDERETEKDYQERIEREKRQKELEVEIEKGRQKRRELELEREKRQESDIEFALERQKERLRALEREREEEQARLLKLEQEQQYELEKIKKLEDQKWREEQRFVEIERERKAEIQQKIDAKLREEQEQSIMEREKESEEKWREEERLAEIDRERLLRKREKQEENLLKKSVSFQDNLKVEDLEQTSDSGIQSGCNSREGKISIRVTGSNGVLHSTPPTPQYKFVLLYLSGQFRISERNQNTWMKPPNFGMQIDKLPQSSL